MDNILSFLILIFRWELLSIQSKTQPRTLHFHWHKENEKKKKNLWEYFLNMELTVNIRSFKVVLAKSK